MPSRLVPFVFTAALVAGCSDNEPSSAFREPTPGTPAPLVSAPETSTTMAAASVPVRCPGYKHPLHHLSCDEANRRTAARRAQSHTPVTARIPATVERQVTTQGDWVIPDYIVECESGGSWTAENPSGAAGPYQLMPEHFGGESALNQTPEEQHAKAAELWNGGRGADNWKACL